MFSRSDLVSEFVSLTCPSCGGNLNISNDVERFACAYCGREHVVRRGEGFVSLTPVLDAIKSVETGVNRTASELAIVRLQREIDDLERRGRWLFERDTPLSSDAKSYSFIALGTILVVAGLFRIKLDGVAYIFVGVVVVGSALLWMFSKRRSKRRREQEVAERMRRVFDELAKKRAEQDVHRKVVGR